MTTYSADENGAWNPAVETHEQWRRRRVREQQRARRARYPRLDYYPSPEALAAVEAVRRTLPPYPAGARTNSAILDALVTGAWEELKPE